MRIGIAGYGNLGRAVEIIARDHEDVEVTGVFTRRSVSEIKTMGAHVFSYEELFDRRDDIDVLMLCYGSSSDLPKCTPELTHFYNTVDTFDIHKEIDEHKARTDAAAKDSSHVSVISAGWDPGFLSLMRVYFSAFLPSSSVNTFWGRGVSQGHSEALRRIPWVKKAIQYTTPKPEALTLASLVSHPLDDTDRHKRVCYIAAEKGREDDVRQRVLSMENYFSGYDTEIHFIDENDALFDKCQPSHRGRIYALGQSGVYKENKHSVFFDLELSSNPELTAHIALACARVCLMLSLEKRYGAYTVFDITPNDFCNIMVKKPSSFL